MKPLFTILLFIFCISIIHSQDWAIKQLETSPRHQENITISYGEESFSCFMVYPEVSEKVPVIILIHENRGLNDWARSMADQMAGMGYIVIAPDFLSGKAPNGGNTPDFDDSDAARTAIYELSPSMITNHLKATEAYAKQIPSANGEVAVMGFCWGGSQTFRHATNSDVPKAYFVFYGSGPQDPADYQNISAPVYGFYGGDDNRVNATIDMSKEVMHEYDKTYKPEIYPGAGHGFMRSGQAPDASDDNKKAREQALSRLKKLLSQL
ncbi:dienelactone hydrolase family protein [Marinigracilibium pacificum]|uniref:Dienelactone hydrolase family protein n=1 Tax=Marinigracilibium pacificum TaxID=2729599 RepID=A0A848J7M1_9BACT|nr:dienelactone hydrolase family protein [Marinigracilibium pacificum]NMM50399.1 dienelactone hydrolase family protein [Marinigracilibium pacificum]